MGISAWYLYGITRRASASSRESANAPALGGGPPVELLSCGKLAAIVTPVPAALCERESLRARLQDTTLLEGIARWHQQVVEAFHRERGVLPAKLGCVYGRIDDLLAALEPLHDVLLDRLGRVEGHDEWGVRLYVDAPAIRRRITAEDPSVQQLQRQLVGARPGLAYFLERKLAEMLTLASDRFIGEMAQTAYDRLLCCASAGQVSQQHGGQAGPNGRDEILRAAFLIPRARAAGFVEEIQRFVESQEGLRCEYSGPWPPYSFATSVGEAASVVIGQTAPWRGGEGLE